VLLSALSIYIAYDITRIASGAQRAWYLIMLGFVVLLIRTATGLYFDVQTPVDVIDAGESLITLIVVVFFVFGLFALDRTFRKQFRVRQESSRTS
jgi:hypothetical protein